MIRALFAARIVSLSLPAVIIAFVLPLTSHSFVEFQSQSGGIVNIFEGPASVALGGAGLAAKSPNESGHINPATLPLLDGSHFGFIYGAESSGPRSGSNKYHLVLAEATDEVAFPGALTYSKIGAFKDGKDATLQEVHGGFGLPISDYISLGGALKYMILEGVGLEQASGFNSTLGFLVTPHRSWGFAFVYDDFVDSKEIPMNSSMGIGAQYVINRILRFRADAVLPQENNPTRKLILKTGMESLFIGHDINVRIGYRWDNYRAERFFGTGIGWQGPRLGLNYAYEKNSLSEDFRHLIDMTLLF